MIRKSTISQEFKEKISKEVINLLSSNKSMSQNHLSRKIGISASQLFNVQNASKWNLISEKLWLVMGNYFQQNEEWKTISTFNYSAIQELCNDSQSNKRMLAVTGKSGLGKTTALKAYAHKNSDTFYVLVDYLQRSKEFYKAIAVSLNLEVIGNARTILQAIVEKVQSLKHPLIILDDAGKLNDGNYRNIQLLFDATEGRAGIVLAGTPYLKGYVDKMTLKGKMGFDELRRRIEYWQSLRDPRIQEVEVICKEAGITDESCVSYLFNAVKDFGTMKSMITSAKRSKKIITPELLASIKP